MTVVNVKCMTVVNVISTVRLGTPLILVTCAFQCFSSSFFLKCFKILCFRNLFSNFFFCL